MTGKGPSSITAVYQAALTAQKAKRFDDARRLYRQILDQRPLAEPMFQLGQIAAETGDRAGAAKWYRKALKLKPKEPALWHALIAVSRGGEREKARRQAKAAGVALPAPGQDLVESADMLVAAGRLDAAKDRYREAIKTGAPATAVLTYMGARLSHADDHQGALVALNEAIDLAPKAPSARVLRATLYQTMGELDLAETELRKVLDVAPFHGPAWLALMRGRKQPVDSTDVAALEARLADGVSDADARRQMSFALAKALEDQGRYGEVFVPLTVANQITARRFPYGFDSDLKSIRARLRHYEPDVFDGFADAAPIFVTGLPRSGTTLVETILSAHPDVAAGGEMALFDDTIRPLVEAASAGQMPPTPDWLRAGRAWADKAQVKAGDGRVTDKSISTFSMMGYVARALPGAKFVLLNRDPRDVGLSLYKNQFADGQHRYSNSLREIGRYIRLFEAVTAEWRRMMPDRVHIIDYDALTSDPEPEIRRLLAFCDLGWNPACLNPEQTGRAVKTLSVAQVRQPINRGSVGAWRRFEAELQPLIEALDTEITL